MTYVVIFQMVAVIYISVVTCPLPVRTPGFVALAW